MLRRNSSNSGDESRRLLGILPTDGGGPWYYMYELMHLMDRESPT